jgi:tetratricopeptide (TPR) repeat protein
LPATPQISSSNITPPPTTEPPSNATTSDVVPEPVVTGTAPAPKKSITQRLNPLKWFAGKPKGAGAANEVEPPPLPAGSRYEYPPPVTPIPGNRAQAKQLVDEAAHERQLGDTARSLSEYQAATTADPTFYDAYYGLGVAALNARDYPKALEALHRALALREDSSEARYAFAWALQKRGYTEDAVHELSRLVEQHPSEARAHLLLGSLYAEKLHQAKLAREQFLQTLELDPGNPQADSIRAWLKLNP